MSALIRIKFVSKTRPDAIDSLWRPLLLDGSDQIGQCQFTFDSDATDYDFLVVYEDLPPRDGEKKVLRTETLACAPENTLLLTTEPASIRIDGLHYLRQYGHVWTAKHPSLVQHPHQIRKTPPLRFFYGRNLAGGDHLPLAVTPPLKSKTLSAMSSTKAMDHTVHAQRLSFIRALKDILGDEMELFGRGISPVDDKAEAMAVYRYHIAVENHVEPGHFTEKLTDCFVAGCLPFYFGDPAYAERFPEDAVIPIDIFDLKAAVNIIRTAISENQFHQRREALAKARALTLDQYNTLRAVAAEVQTIYDPDAKRGGAIKGRHAFRRSHPFKAAVDALFVTKARRSPKASPLQFGIAD